MKTNLYLKSLRNPDTKPTGIRWFCDTKLWQSVGGHVMFPALSIMLLHVYLSAQEVIGV